MVVVVVVVVIAAAAPNLMLIVILRTSRLSIPDHAPFKFVHMSVVFLAADDQARQHQEPERDALFKLESLESLVEDYVALVELLEGDQLNAAQGLASQAKEAVPSAQRAGQARSV